MATPNATPMATYPPARFIPVPLLGHLYAALDLADAAAGSLSAAHSSPELPNLGGALCARVASRVPAMGRFGMDVACSADRRRSLEHVPRGWTCSRLSASLSRELEPRSLLPTSAFHPKQTLAATTSNDRHWPIPDSRHLGSMTRTADALGHGEHPDTATSLWVISRNHRPGKRKLAHFSRSFHAALSIPLTHPAPSLPHPALLPRYWKEK